MAQKPPASHAKQVAAKRGDARELIEENKRTKSPFLDLGNCGLTQFPLELAELPWLETLVLTATWADWASEGLVSRPSANRGEPNDFGYRPIPLTRLPITALYADGTNFKDVSCFANLSALQDLSISSASIADFSALAELVNLRRLNLTHTSVADLSCLANITTLQVLALGGTPVADLSPLATLPDLQRLFVWGTKVSDLTPLARLISLQDLTVGMTQVADLTPLAKLTHLQRLHISNTRVSDLSAVAPLLRSGIQAKLSGPAEPPVIYVSGCPLTNPPSEIVRQGNEAILNYFEERKSGVDQLYEAKMLILGKGGAGKTSLLRRLYYPGLPLPEQQETTKGIDIHRQDFSLANGKEFRLNVWDFGGQEIYHATHQFFLTKRSIYVLVDDTKEDNKSVSDEGFKYWLDLVEVFGGASPVLIFQNEKGGRSKSIGFQGIQARYPNVKRCYAGNLENPHSADELREAIVRCVSTLEHIGEELPAKWLRVRADIEGRAAETPYITQDEYFRIYSRYLDSDRTKALFLSRYLHDLGVFLHFQDDPLLTRTVVLQNQWATEAVFKVLDDEKVKERGGRFEEADCKRIWSASAYADMHPELLALMKNFELCYELRDSRPAAWLAPQLFSPNRPPRFLNWAKPSDMILRYRYTFLPKGIVSRLTVRLHRFISDPGNDWRTGVLFEREATQVLVELLPEGSEIELRARGPGRKELLSVVSSDLDALNDSFEGLKDKVDRLIPCACGTCAAGTSPHFFEQKDLLRRREKGQRTAECKNSYDAVDVRQLLDGFKIEELPGWAKETPLKPIRIFLASSAELREDRDAFDLFVQRRNAELYRKGLILIVDRWEYFLDAISETRLQDEYNKSVRNSDIFVSLFSTKAGKFTKEEFEVAYGQFKSNAKPRIYTYFKDAATTMGSVDERGLRSLRAFQKKLGDLGHFYTGYKNLDALKLHFSEQLEKLLES